MQRIGIFGGSFNPIHNGHIAVAEELLHTNFVDEIWFVISPQNPLKQQSDLMPDSLRYKLAATALENRPKLMACDIEFHLPKPSYMWTTLAELCKKYQEKQFVLLIGADNWLVFDRWYRYEDIIKKYDIGIYPRPNYNINEAELPKNVRYFNTGLYNISSTEIRRRLASGEDISELVPLQIAKYLQKL